MPMKSPARRYFWIVLVAFLAACGTVPPEQAGNATATNLPNSRSIMPTLAIVPTSPPSESTATPVDVTASPLPPSPAIPIITPNPAQLERWKEYQTALAKKMMRWLPPEEVLCEWEILGQLNQEVYVWAVCSGTDPLGNSGLFSEGEEPAVIHLGADGSIRSVEIPGAGTSYARDIRKLFPPDVQGRIFGNLIHYRQLSEHLEWRRKHSNVPPLIIFGATPQP